MTSPHLKAEIRLLPAIEGGRSNPVISGYRGQFHLHGEDNTADVEWIFPEVELVLPGESALCHIRFYRPELHLPALKAGDSFEIREGRRVIGRGRIVEVFTQRSAC